MVACWIPVQADMRDLSVTVKVPTNSGVLRYLPIRRGSGLGGVPPEELGLRRVVYNDFNKGAA